MPRAKKSPFAQLVKWAVSADVFEMNHGLEIITEIRDQRFPKKKQDRPKRKKAEGCTDAEM